MQWECRMGKQALIGSCLNPTLSFGIDPKISQKLLNAFKIRTHKLKILQHMADCDPIRGRDARKI
jgi:hypothetical protein